MGIFDTARNILKVTNNPVNKKISYWGNELAQKVLASNQAQYFNPSAFNGNNFWSTPVANQLGNIQQRIQTGELIRPIQAPPTANLTTKLGVTAGNIAINMFNSVYGKGITSPVSDIFRNVSNIATGQNPLKYEELNSGFSRLGYQLAGALNPDSRILTNAPELTNVKQTAGNIASAGLPILDAYSPKGAMNLSKNLLTEARRKALVPAIKSGFKTGATIGGAYGFTSGLADNRNTENNDEYLMNVGMSTGIGAGVGGLLSAAVSGSGVAFNRLLSTVASKYRELRPSASPEEALKIADKYVRDELGRFAEKGKNKRTVFYGDDLTKISREDLRESLGLPRDGLYLGQNRKGAIDLGYKFGDENTNSAKELLKKVNPGGLMSESPAMTKFRRSQQLQANEVYGKVDLKKRIKDISSAFKANNLSAIENYQREYDPGFTKVTKKVNLLDYLRPPQDVLNKIGLTNQSRLLRTQYEKYLTELPQEISKIQDWMKQVPNKESSAKIFNYLDGMGGVLTPEESKVASEIKSYLAEWANKLNLPKDKRVSSYITHIFEKDALQTEFDDDIASLIDKKVAGSVYNPFTISRKKNEIPYIQDVFRALDAYVKRATRAYNMDPALKTLKDASFGLELSQVKYLERLTARINLRPTELDNLLDNLIKSSPIGYRFGQRPVTAISRNIRQHIYRGALGLNFSSALRNLTQFSNTYATLGEKYTGIGYLKMAKNWNTGELERVGVLRDSFIQDQTITAMNSLTQKIDKSLFYFFERAEKINRGSAYFGAKQQALDKGLSEENAIEFAKEMVRKTQFQFGSIDTPLALQSDLAKTLTQFGSYSVRQLDFLANMIKNKQYLGLVRYIGSTLVLAKVLKDEFGMKVDLLPQLNLSPTAQFATNIVPAIYGSDQQKDESRNKLANTGLLLIPGGVQAKKTITGINDYMKGRSETAGGNERYQVAPGAENLLKSVFLGSRATDAGQEYYDNFGVSTGEKIYKNIEKLTPEMKAKYVREMKANNPAQYRAFVRYMEDKRLNISSGEKRIRNMNVTDGSRARAVVNEMRKQKTPEGKANIYKRYLMLGIMSEDVQAQVQAMIRQGALK